jgi:hypothetical protein
MFLYLPKRSLYRLNLEVYQVEKEGFYKNLDTKAILTYTQSYCSKYS